VGRGGSDATGLCFLQHLPELIRWTKGFGAPNVEGHDVAAMFEKSLKKYVSRIDQMSVPDYMFLIRPFRAPTERPNQDDRLD